MISNLFVVYPTMGGLWLCGLIAPPNRHSFRLHSPHPRPLSISLPFQMRKERERVANRVFLNINKSPVSILRLMARWDLGLSLAPSLGGDKWPCRTHMHAQDHRDRVRTGTRHTIFSILKLENSYRIDT